MKTRFKYRLATAATAIALAATGATAQVKVGGADMFANRNIVENAVNSPIHKTLVAAVQAADLVETLSGDGPFTVFAPIDTAFGALPEGTVEELVKPENKEQLTKILTCHVVAADAMYGAIRGMIADDGGTHPIETLGGCVLQAKMDGRTITVTDENGTTARVLVPDVDQSNGVIHVVDAVLLPASGDTAMDDGMDKPEMAEGDESMSEGMSDEAAAGDETMSDDMKTDDKMSEDMAEGMGEDKEMSGEMAEEMSGDMDKEMAETSNPMVGGAEMFPDKTIVENAINSADHTILVDAVVVADLVDTLSGEGPFTVFAPTDAAFEALPEGTVPTLLMDENRDQLTKILTCHVVAADVMSEALIGMVEDDGGVHEVETVGGCMLKASVENGMVKIEDEQGGVATVTIADVDQSNGVIHVVDRVLLPTM